MVSIEQLKLRKKSRVLEVRFDDGVNEQLDFEFLRIHSPSAEVKGHGKGQERLQTGKQNVVLLELIPVGNYAVKLIFDDGHDSGIYTWDYLYELCVNKEKYWNIYRKKLESI